MFHESILAVTGCVGELLQRNVFPIHYIISLYLEDKIVTDFVYEYKKINAVKANNIFGLIIYIYCTCVKLVLTQLLKFTFK